ncbi:MAG: cation:proton antiporter [Dehalococcoidia bacterium]
MEAGPTELVTRLVYQLAIILFAAKLGGEIFERILKQPPVLGELLAGVAIGPFALGGLDLGGLGPLFLHAGSAGGGFSIPVSPELWAFAQVAAIVLLFSAGLETDLVQFLRYAGPAALVALGGVVVPFALGVAATVAFGISGGFLSPEALFMGAIMAPTSVGITARVLADIKRLDAPEGVTILAAGVLDDVLAILALTFVAGISAAGSISVTHLLAVGGKALGFWVALMVLGILLSRYISRFLMSFRVSGARVSLALALAFLFSGLAESFGLAMIIGAYTIGLALSHTELARSLARPVAAVYHFMVPIFFVVMGMLVDIPAIGGVLVFGIVFSVLAILGKVLGSGLPALGVGFNRTGAGRIGIGMLPRGEVALIIAGAGLARGIIGVDLFGVSIMMTFVTTLLAPMIMVPLFRNRASGRRA